MNLPWIVAGALAVAAVLALWRWLAVSKEVDAVRRAADETRAHADEARHALKAAQTELEQKRREVSEHSSERNDLKKKLFDAKEDAKRQKGSMKSRENSADTYEQRLRDMNHELSEARESVPAAKRAREEAEKVIGEVRVLRERVAALEAEKLRLQQQPRVPREPREPQAPRPERAAAPAAGNGADLAAELLALKRKVFERDRDLQTAKRRLDNANRIYFITKSQLDLAHDKIAQQGFQFATLLAIHEGRPPPRRDAEPSSGVDSAAEAQAMAEAMDESEPILPPAAEPSKPADGATH